ncbi:MAG: hypothetical protein DI547_08995 [Sphingobium sp.]|nr:MAG: hypothetical protein DI547_08995 [Sphingobium sp.]
MIVPALISVALLAGAPTDAAQSVIASVQETPAPAQPTTAPPAAPETSGARSAATQEGQPAQPPAEEQDSIVVTGRGSPPPTDPLQDINAKTFKVTQDVDKAVVAPVADVYENGIPRPIRRGLGNFLSNLTEPVVFLNYLLQLKPGKATETLGRFTVNTTIGIAGLLDVAKKKPFNLPYRPNGFANTFGYYGIKPGPYFYLPLIGPTTLRDLTGTLIDKMVLPIAVGSPFNKPAYAIPAVVISTLNDRIGIDTELRRMRAESSDPYATTREYYLERRHIEIEALHGRHIAPTLSSPPPVQQTPARQAPEAPLAPTTPAPGLTPQQN